MSYHCLRVEFELMNMLPFDAKVTITFGPKITKTMGVILYAVLTEEQSKINDGVWRFGQLTR